MMFVKISGIIIICLIGTCVLKQIKSEYAILLVATTVILCFSLLLKEKLNIVLDVINQLTETTEIKKYVLILFKALGISYLTFLTSEICTNAGEDVLSNISLIAGKFEIISLCIPLASELIEITRELL